MFLFKIIFDFYFYRLIKRDQNDSMLGFALACDASVRTQVLASPSG